MGTMPIVGLDANGKIIEQMIDQNQFKTKMKGAVTDLQETIIPVLDSDQARTMMDLREAELGLHLKGSAGFGDYFKLAGTIGFRLVFTNKGT
jgi:hypothetical protein